MLGPVLAMLAASVLLSACGGGSKAPAPSSGSPYLPYPGTPVAVVGGVLNTVTAQGGAQKGRKQPGGYITVSVPVGSLLFIIRTMPQTAVFRYRLYELPELREVPTRVTVKTISGFKALYVRPSAPLAPSLYQLVYGGTGRFQMAVYEVGAR